MLASYRFKLSINLRLGGCQVSDRCLTRRTAIAATAVVAASAAAPRRLWADEYADVVPLASSDEVEFLYIDAAEMELGAEQNIVISLTDYKTVDDASMIVRGMEARQEIELPLGSCVDGAMLFNFVPEDADRYEVATLTNEFELNQADLVSVSLDDETLKSLNADYILTRERLGAARARLLGLKEIAHADGYRVYGRG